MKLCLFTSLNTNVGDDFIREGILNLFKNAGIKFKYTTINKHDPKSLFDFDGKNKINHSDFTILCGTPVFWSINGSTSYNCDWINWFYKDHIFSGNHKLIILAAGSCNNLDCNIEYLCNNDFELKDFTKKISSKASFISTRDFLCRDLLNNYGISNKLLFCTALNCIEEIKPSSLDAKYISVNFMENFGHFSNFQMFTRKFREILNEIRNHGPIKFICHDQKEFDFALQNKQGSDIVFYSKNYKDYFNIFEDVLLHISCRVHGSILASSAVVPNINIITDSRGYSCDRLSTYSFDPNIHSYYDLKIMIEFILDNRECLKENLIFFKNYNQEEYIKVFNQYFSSFSSEGA
jgi:hypothetical protein